LLKLSVGQNVKEQVEAISSWKLKPWRYNNRAIQIARDEGDNAQGSCSSVF